MSFEMNRQQTYKGSNFHVGWMRGILAYNNSLSPVHMVPSRKSHLVKRSQHGGQVPTSEPRKPLKYGSHSLQLSLYPLKSNLDYFMQNIIKTCVESWVQLSLNPTLNASLMPHLQKMLPHTHPCHTWDLGLGIPCRVIKVSTSMLSTTNIARIDLSDLGLRIPCGLALVT